MSKILKGAVVLLIAFALVFSTVVIADTQTKLNIITLTSGDETSGEGIGARGAIVWDNGMNYDSLLAAQEPVNPPDHLDAYPADDFHFEETTEVCDVHWIGGFWSGEPEPWNWCIVFYYDRGDGAAPGNVYAGPFCYDWENIGWELLEPYCYEMWVDLPENIPFPPYYKFWISIWAVGDHFPQSGWGFHEDPIKLHEAVFKSNWFDFPDWTDTSKALGYPVDMCFQLTTKIISVPIIDFEEPSITNLGYIPLTLENRGTGTAYNIMYEMKVIERGGLFGGMLFFPKEISGTFPSLGPNQSFSRNLKIRGLGITTIYCGCKYIIENIRGSNMEFEIKQEWTDFGLLSLHFFLPGMQPEKEWMRIENYSYFDDTDQGGVELSYGNVRQMHNVRVAIGSGSRAPELFFQAACKFYDGKGVLIEYGITRGIVESGEAHWEIELVDGG